MDTNQDLFEPKKKLPGGLNALTILTFIGCGISYLGVLYSFFTSSDYMSNRDKIEEAREKVRGSFMEGMMPSPEMMQKTYDNRYVLFACGLIFTTFCLIGAIQMRKLKKSGYTLYVIGELAPFIVNIAIFGIAIATGFQMLFAIGIALLFVLLYTLQRKHLVN